MKRNRGLLVLLGAALVSAGALAADLGLLPKGVKLPKDVKVPNEVALAGYIPETHRTSRSYLKSAAQWVEPGKALDDARREVGGQLFTKVIPVDLNAPADDTYGLLVALQPGWTLEGGKLTLTLRYRVFGADGTQQHLAEVSQSTPLNLTSPAAGVTAVAMKAMQLALVDVLVATAPTEARFPSTAALANIDYTRLINREQPVSTGTAFYINKSGQLLTAAHVLRDCGLIEAEAGERQMRVTRNAYSDLLDLAVVDTGEATTKSIPLRIGTQMTLGEPVTNVGYPLQGLLAGSANLTRGNISARGGLKGSMGVFQFSAPIQPGSSGGPVVSDGGELLGITVSTLNAAALIKEGLLPQNVNFALDASYAARFLRKVHVQFDEVTPNTQGSMQIANDAALGAVVKLSCYQ